MKVSDRTQNDFHDTGHRRHARTLAMGMAAAAMALLPLSALAQGIPPVVWNTAGSFQYDSGEAPSVAVSGLVVVEVHEGTDGALWYHTGKIEESGTVTWASQAQYGDGYAPSVAVSGNEVVEVHQAGTGTGPLWYDTGKIGAKGTVTWSGPFEYDNGSLPSVAVCGQTIVEVH